MIVTKRSIREIPVSRKTVLELEKKVGKKDEQVEFEAPKLRRSLDWQRKPLNPKFVLWSIAVICILALFFGISILFSSATLVIIPRIEKIAFNSDSYIAKLNSQSTTDLPFEILNIKQSVGEIIEATEEKEVSKKASGNIIIYNNYSTAPQRLINNTRFESSNGKVYRINSSVVVPGLKKVAGKVVPGSIEATVYADQAGEGYNLKIADLAGDFKIPGFKGDPRYDSFYARIKTDIQGGFIGKQRIISEELREKTEVLIKEELKQQLIKELYSVKPDNYLFFKDGYYITYTNLPDTAVDSDKAQINIEGNLGGIIFNNNKLSRFFATKKIEGFDDLQTVFIPNENLVVSFKADNVDLTKNTSLSLVFNGDAIIKWHYDTFTLRQDLVGKKEADLKNLTSKYKNLVTSIEVVFKPVWTRYFPDNINKIRIEEKAL